MKALLLRVSVVLSIGFQPGHARAAEQLKVRLSWGHRVPTAAAHFVQAVSHGLDVAEVKPLGLEPGETLGKDAWQTQAGGGDVDTAEIVLRYRQVRVEPLRNLPATWRDLIALSDPDTARRLTHDPAYRRDPRRITFRFDREATRGLTVTLDQLLHARSLWVPSLGVYIDAGSEPVSLEQHLGALKALRGKRILDQVQRDPEAGYERFKELWEDLGSPTYRHPAQPAPGHIVGVSWDSAIRKFGIDRGAGVWNDYGNPDRFRTWFDFGDLATLAESWKGQRLTDGYPVLVTTFERRGIRYEVEQFAYPLHGPPSERRGDIAMVLLEKVRLTELLGQQRTAAMTLHHRRKLDAKSRLEFAQANGGFSLVNVPREDALLVLDGLKQPPKIADSPQQKDGMTLTTISLSLEVPARGSRELLIKLPSPIADRSARPALLGLNYDAARTATLKFWADYEARGARFHVPEAAVNELFRANLWHALRLPRRHGGEDPSVKIDLPYSNFAYDQKGSPWPVNQAVYVDYMIYALRGYHDVATEELAVMFRNNQEPNGHIGGYANWLVYTPSMLYTVAQNYLLSGQRETLQPLLPASLKAMDWCLAELEKAKKQSGTTRGLVRGPLNDGTGEGYWAFSQAYLFAGLDLFGRALRRYGHPRAEECLAAAGQLRAAIDRAFHAAAVESPLVQLRDHTWTPYVPCEVTRPGRLLDQWYPTDVDTGAVHLLRLKAVPARGDLADALLGDHEDNLYLHGWGMANEPVYNPQATAYLLRDDPKAVIRAFYSMMACAFSHSVFEPVEHRWTHGQYFGPPSTDGAWAEVYRNMLIQERDDGSLLLFAATPRKWLEDGKRIEIERAPTYYGRLSATLESHANSGKITAAIVLSGPDRPKALVVRFRHPQSSSMRSARVNGERWTRFDSDAESVRIDNPAAKRHTVRVGY